MAYYARSAPQTAPPGPKTLVDELFEAARTGDRQRFDGLANLWLNVVFSECVRSTGDREAAEELTREVLARAIRRTAL